MGKYTQTLNEYLDDLDLDFFNDDDLVLAAKTLKMYDYPGIPKPVMNKLFVLFFQKYSRYEMNWLSVDEFRMQLRQYQKSQETWYTSMFATFSDLLPYDMLKATTTTTSESDKNSNANTMTHGTGNTLTTGKNSNKVVSANNGHGSNIADSTVNVDTVNNTDSTTTNDGTSSDDSHVQNSHNSTTGVSGTSGSTTTYGKKNETNNAHSGDDAVKDESTVTTKSRDKSANGQGNLTAFPAFDSANGGLNDDGVMISDTKFNVAENTVTHGGQVTTTHGENVKVTSQDDGTDSVSGVTSSDTTAEASDDNTTNNSGTTHGTSVVGAKVTGSNDTTTHATGSNQTSASGTQDTNGSNNGSANTINSTQGNNNVIAHDKGKVTTESEGLQVWKPELARKFYDNFVNIDNEWVDKARDLFLMVY